MFNSLGEVASEIKSTLDGGERFEAVNGIELGVVGNLDSAVDGFQEGHGNIVQFVVVNKDKIAS